MGKPKSIRFRMVSGWAEIRINGYRRKDSKPYLHLDIGNKGSPEAWRYGYMEDRDIKRLKKWCEDCLKKR